MAKLTSTCCGAEDRLFRRVLDMSYSEMGICPKCGEHCDFECDELIQELSKVVTGDSLISIAIRKAISDHLSHIDIIEYLKSQARDNVQMMADIIGIELTNKILKL